MVTTAKAMTVERRIYKRFEADLPVIITAASGETFECRALNVSLAGMEVRTDRWTVTQVCPKGEKTTPDQSPVVRMQLDLPTPEGETRSILVDCRILIVRRVAQEDYHLHIQYEFFQGNGYDELEEYVDAKLAIHQGEED